MKQTIFTILENTKVAQDVYRMRLSGDTADFTHPGQFLNIKLEGLFLRRPISVSDYDEKSVLIYYKVVGIGTRQMSEMKSGETLDILTGLGNGFDPALSGEQPLVVGGGVGTPPLYRLTKALLAAGKHPTVVLGFNTAADLFLTEEFEALGVPVIVATADGSVGIHGFVTDAIREAGISYDYVYTCGPEPMLKALYRATDCPGQYSFEARMGCGFGACMGCSCKTITGYKRICKEGPVLLKEEILWEN
ncbi:MAG: dihydroorotate dehydrogenase electron transfer subunit [Ruminococcaceae bacterium]|nr:dihydroorotate dehydrogenase electron transfer subunit [Oscillospiraceae bacterium]